MESALQNPRNAACSPSLTPSPSHPETAAAPAAAGTAPLRRHACCPCAHSCTVPQGTSSSMTAAWHSSCLSILEGLAWPTLLSLAHSHFSLPTPPQLHTRQLSTFPPVSTNYPKSPLHPHRASNRDCQVRTARQFALTSGSADRFASQRSPITVLERVMWQEHSLRQPLCGPGEPFGPPGPKAPSLQRAQQLPAHLLHNRSQHQPTPAAAGDPLQDEAHQHDLAGGSGGRGTFGTGVQRPAWGTEPVHCEGKGCNNQGHLRCHIQLC
jgi:hypothetical protein